MCDYTGRHFGARYPDASCIDGYLWDLDSCDEDGMLTTGGDMPCKACNGAAWLREVVEDVANTFAIAHGMGDGFTLWERTIEGYMKFSSEIARAALLDLGPCEIMDADTETVRAWPWPGPTVSAHLVLEICMRGRPGADADAGAEAGAWPCLEDAGHGKPQGSHLMS